ncbi:MULTISPECIES: hypothetical protein [unclassified Gordonia (in: high G+C Gram-positive bacteria)]|uniref:hypothetical protein n=1 Tax=unclassified Gordonia (in: high G+C Gram-positive bacteria) TaxID=2657482 RepID=UPI00027DE2F7|nr:MULTISPECIES: hypothetical protein [unclassified Gordonia (in: high G+C Gram-positive bacteria)]AFR49122.1 hypothetical protein KTR9_2485 [Gordonia sp. KTR9]
MSNEPFSANPSGHPPTPGGPGQPSSGAYPPGAVPPAGSPPGTTPSSASYPVGSEPGTAPATDPTTDATPVKPTAGERANAVVKKVVIGLVIAALLVVTYFILEAFLPRWWAGQIGQRVEGSFSRGIGTGLVLGIVCTFVPVLFFTLSFVYRGRMKNVPTIMFAVLGVIVAVPNLLTLTVVAGGGNGAHAGERIFDVEAPGFRAATAWGVIIGAVLAVGVGYFIWRYRRRGRQLREIKHPTTDRT